MGQAEFHFLLVGLKWTVILSAAGFAFGGVAGLFVALARTSGFPALERTMAAYIAFFQGTPLLMQLFVSVFRGRLLRLAVAVLPVLAR